MGIRQWMQERPELASGIVGGIMGIPSDETADVIEGVQGGLGGYRKGVAEYQAKQKAAEAEQRAIERQQWERIMKEQGLAVQQGQLGVQQGDLQRKWYHEMNLPDPTAKTTSDLSARLRWWMGLKPGEKEAYQELHGGKGRAQQEQLWQAMRGAIKAAYPMISDADALLLSRAKYRRISTVNRLMKEMDPKENQRGVFYKTENEPKYALDPVSVDVLRRYKINPNDYMNQVGAPAQYDQSGLMGDPETPESPGGGGILGDLPGLSEAEVLDRINSEEDVDTLIGIGADDFISAEQYQAVVDKLRKLGIEDPEAAIEEYRTLNMEPEVPDIPEPPSRRIPSMRE